MYSNNNDKLLDTMQNFLACLNGLYYVYCGNIFRLEQYSLVHALQVSKSDIVSCPQKANCHNGTGVLTSMEVATGQNGDGTQVH